MTTRARLYDARGDDRDVAIGDVPQDGSDDRKLLWIDLDDRAVEEIDAVARALDLEPRIVRQLGRDRRRPRIVRQPNRIAMTLITVESDDKGTYVRKDLDLVAGQNLIVTVHDGPIRAISEFEEELGGERDVGLLDAGAFLTGIVDSVLTGYLREVEVVEREIDALDEVAMRTVGPDDDRFLATVVALRHRIAILRRSLTPNREALTPLIRPDFEVKEDIIRPWPGL